MIQSIKKPALIALAVLCLVLAGFALVKFVLHPGQPTSVNVATLKGPSSVGVLKMMDDEQASTSEKSQDTPKAHFKFSVFSKPDEVAAQLGQGKVDIAMVPANMASILYNKTKGGICVIDINTQGGLKLVSRNKSLTMQDLKGKAIVLAGKGATPEIALSYVLDEAGLSDSVTLDYKSEQQEVAASMAKDSSAVALLPEPFASMVCAKNPELHISADLDSMFESYAHVPLVMGVTVARKDFVKDHEQLVRDFVAQQIESVDWVKTHPEQAADLAQTYEIFPDKKLALQAIAQTNLCCVTGRQMKDSLQAYLAILMQQNPKAVGETLPDDAFYWMG